MKKFFRAFALVTAVSMFTRLCSFAFKIYLSRSLGAEILGLYQISMSLLMLFASLSSSGLPVTLSRLTAEGQINPALKDRAPSLFGSALIGSLMLSLPFVVIFGCFPDLLSYLFSDSRCVTIFLIMSPMLLTTAVYSVVRGWFWGKKDFVVFSVSELCDELLKILFSVFLLSGVFFTVNKLYAYAIAMLITDVIITVGLVICYFVKGGKIGKPAEGRQLARSAAPLTVTRLAGSLMSTFLSLAIPSLLVKYGGLTTAQATAEFGRAGGMVMPLIFAPTSIIGSLGVVLIPEIASFGAKASKTALGRELSKSLKFAFLTSSFFYMLFFALGDPIATMLYADDYVGKYLTDSALLMIPMGVNGLCVSMLNSLGKETQTFVSHLTACVFLVVAAVWLPRYVGIYAYFISLFVFHTVSMCINLVLLSRCATLPLKQGVQCLGAFVFSSVGAIGLRLLYRLSSGYIGSIASMIGAAILGAALFLLYMTISKTADLTAFVHRGKGKKSEKTASKRRAQNRKPLPNEHV